jgi:hypothetical protein
MLQVNFGCWQLFTPLTGDNISIADIVLAECFTYEPLLSFSSFSRCANIRYYNVYYTVVNHCRRWHALVKRTLVHWCSINDTFDKFSQFWRGVNSESITTDHTLEQSILFEGTAPSVYSKILFGVTADSKKYFKSSTVYLTY